MAYPSIESITFDTSAMTPLPEENTVSKRVWFTPERDIVSVQYLAAAPEIPAGLDQLDALRVGYRKLANDKGLALIEAEVVDTAGCRMIWLLLRCYRNHTVQFISPR
jgi:hypothetical protein